MRPLHHGVLAGERKRQTDGFTLLEICFVLLIIAMLFGAVVPAIQSTFVENSVRGDARQLALMVKTAMLQSSDQHCAYVIDLTTDSMNLHPLETPTSATEEDTDAADRPAAPKTELSYQLDNPDKLFIPDPNKASAWIHMPATSWIFQPGALCPATRVRLTRGASWMELNFNPLTGNIENETDYFP